MRESNDFRIIAFVPPFVHHGIRIAYRARFFGKKRNTVDSDSTTRKGAGESTRVKHVKFYVSF